MKTLSAGMAGVKLGAGGGGFAALGVAIADEEATRGGD
jgi:hypothetical protein